MIAMKQLPKYKCHKEVWALKILGVEHKLNPDETGQSAAASYGALLHVAEGFAPIEVSGEWVSRHKPAADGYYVQYADGYTSFSPADAFEDGYHRIDSVKNRLLREREELKERLSKLVAFLPDCDHLPPDEVELLGQQAEHMSDYLAVLDKRIVDIL